MKPILAVLAFTASISVQPALAFDLNEAVGQLNEANFACFEGQNHDGEKISDAQIKSACIDTAALLRVLTINGFCYDEPAREWRQCKQE